MTVKYSRFRHNAKQTSFASPTGQLQQGGKHEHAQYPTNDDVTSGWSCCRPENVSILSSLILMLPRQLIFGSHVFFKCPFSVKGGFFYWLNYNVTLNLALFYQSYYNCQWNPSFLVTSLKKKKKHVVSLMWLEWQMLSEVFNRVHFSRNFIFRRLFCIRSILKYSDYIRFLSKMEYI